MAAAYKIVMTFKDANGKTVSYGYNHADSEPAVNDVKAVMDAFIENGSIFKSVPTEKVSAYVVMTDQTEIAI